MEYQTEKNMEKQNGNCGGYRDVDCRARWNPLPVIVTIRNNGDYIMVLLYPHYTTIYRVGGVHLQSPLMN